MPKGWSAETLPPTLAVAICRSQRTRNHSLGLSVVITYKHVYYFLSGIVPISNKSAKLICGFYLCSVSQSSAKGSLGLYRWICAAIEMINLVIICGLYEQTWGSCDICSITETKCNKQGTSAAQLRYCYRPHQSDLHFDTLIKNIN